MKVRRLLLLLVASVLALTATSAAVPAQAVGCLPNCSIAGQVVGSVIHPGIDFNFKGSFTTGSYPGARFDIEGPYPAGSNGTLRVTGHGAPNFAVTVVVRQTSSGFSVQNASSGQQINANFTRAGNSYSGYATTAGESGGGNVT